MKYGYCRISTRSQSIERQERNILKEYPDARIFKEAYTGRKINRPEFTKLMKTVKAGDVIVFDSVSRMSRNATEGWKTYKKLYDDGVELVFLKEPHINTEVYKQTAKQKISLTGTDVDCILQGINEYLMILAERQVQLAFDQAQKEVDDLRQRTREGMLTAKINGKKIGHEEGQKFETKKQRDSLEVIKKHSKDFNGTLTDAECMKLTGLSRNTYYKYKRVIREGQ